MNKFVLSTFLISLNLGVTVKGFGAEVQNVFHSVYLLDEAGENHVKLSAPDTLTENVNYTLPEQGLSGQVLSTDGLGSLGLQLLLTQ